jgi:hypothetical protein
MSKAIQTETITSKTIKGHEYTGQYIPASKACLIAFKLINIMSGKSDVENLISSGEDNLILKVLSYTLRDGRGINESNFDKIYTGNLGELLEALKYSVEANFSDFLGGKLTGFLQGDQEKVQPIITAN